MHTRKAPRKTEVVCFNYTWSVFMSLCFYPPFCPASTAKGISFPVDLESIECLFGKAPTPFLNPCLLTLLFLSAFLFSHHIFLSALDLHDFSILFVLLSPVSVCQHDNKLVCTPCLLKVESLLINS